MNKIIVNVLDDASLWMGIRKINQPPLRGDAIKQALFRQYVLPLLVFGGMSAAIVAAVLISAWATVKWGA